MKKNLTHENFGTNGSNIESFEMFNSLSGMRPEQWLPEINVITNMMYMDVRNGAGCNAVDPPKRMDLPPERGEARNIFNSLPYAQETTSVCNFW